MLNPYQRYESIALLIHIVSHVYAEHVPPPRRAYHYLLHVCAKEGIHPSRVSLYLRENGSSNLRPATPDEPVQLGSQEEGKETLHFNIDMKNEDREVAAQSIGACTLGSRAMGRGLKGCCYGSAFVVVETCKFSAGIPEAVASSSHCCCVNFR